MANNNTKQNPNQPRNEKQNPEKRTQRPDPAKKDRKSDNR